MYMVVLKLYGFVVKVSAGFVFSFYNSKIVNLHSGTEDKTAEIYFAFFFLFSISHSNVIHREVCDKYFPETIARRIL